MKTEFKIGDRVAMYSGKYGREAGRVQNVFGGSRGAAYRLNILGDDGVSYNAHPKQCRKLKPRAKSVRITRKDLLKAYYNCVFRPGATTASPEDSADFCNLANYLGLDDET